MTGDPIDVQRVDGVAVITLDRPEARNAMNVALAAATCEAIEACQDAGAIVVTGRAPAFCAGLDLRNLGTESLGDLPPFIAAAERSAVPVIAAVNGPAVTGGFELALACDFIIASERAAFADTHLRVGVYPGPVTVYLPRRVGDAWARQMSLTGDFVDAATALRIGIANEVVAHGDLLDRATAVARSIADQDPAMVRALRADMAASVGLPLAESHRAHDEFARERGLRGSTSDQLASRREAVIDRARQQRTTWDGEATPAEP